ncbi:AraC family transcriptional regulator [Cellulomonas sp. NPDC089187]|uniref:AraC family transcriptional regulator n=1 Tax=Cellulomonas sp. NPDC089187 TaxID=3154970 RepID=UPI00342B0FA2
MTSRPAQSASALIRALSPALLTMAEDLTGTMFCAKDVDGRYVMVNDAFVRRTNERSRRGVVGKTAVQLFDPLLAARYDAQDRMVLAGGRELRRELELIRRPGGTPGWYLTSKAPVRGEDATVVGLVSISQALRGQDADPETVASLTRVATVVRDRIGHPPTVAELADAAGCSPAALDRRLRRVFALSPQQYVLRARVDHAAALLGGTALPVAEVARAAGFYDQASFTRTFGRLTGETPAQFRRAARDLGADLPATGGLPWPTPAARSTMET